jgi:hypothetical protein
MANTPYNTTATANFQIPGPALIGTASTDYIGFFGTTPVAKQGGTALATLSLGTITNTTPYGFASKADGDALVAQVKALTAALVAYGIVKQA